MTRSPDLAGAAYFGRGLRRYYFYHMRCLRAFGTVNNLKRYFLSFEKSLEACAFNIAVMYKDVPTLFFLNESESFGLIKPFYPISCPDERKSKRK